MNCAHSIQVPGPVRHVAREIAEADYDYCIAFYNRRTRETTFRPVSLLRVQAQISRPGEKLDSLEERRLIFTSYKLQIFVNITNFRRSQSVNYSLDKSLTLEESREQQRILTDQFGNARKRKALEEQQRRKIDDKLMEAMTSATFDATLDSSAASTSDAKPATFSMLTAVRSIEISLITIFARTSLQPESDIIPKLDKTAKTPDAIFKMEDFFASPEQRDVYKKRAAEWFKENNTAEALNKIGLPAVYFVLSSQSCLKGVPKFIASVIFVGYKKSELHAAVALKASILANVLKVCWPKSSLRTFLCFFYVCLANGTKQCAAGDFIVAPIECVVDVANAFLLGAKPGFYKMQSQHRDRLFLHMIAMYFVLSAPRYIFPFGPALSELASASARVGLSEQTMKKLCMGIGCM